MSYVAAPLASGLIGFDTVDVVTRPGLAPMSEWRARFAFAWRYLPNLGAEELAALTGAGFPVLTLSGYALDFDGPLAVARARALQIPTGATLWCDVEGLDAATPIAPLMASINAWAGAVEKAGYIAGGYFADRTLLTSAEMYGLAITRYARGAARIVDRNGALAQPSCGFCIEQLRPVNAPFGGTRVDFDASTADFFGRVATATIAA